MSQPRKSQLILIDTPYFMHKITGYSLFRSQRRLSKFLTLRLAVFAVYFFMVRQPPGVKSSEQGY
ncbi:MAG: hypothetical protein ACI9C4_002244 [Paraglaciecola sp.]|jgi:hypothetical protein